ncbi:MAG: transcription antitermination factor NusB [Aquificota bacterium]|nr:transcription antitermination factor NusB [Aquificota bacterium]
MRYRKRARENGLIVLYRWDMSGEPPERILMELVEEKGIKNRKVINYTERLVKTVISKITDIDSLIADHLENWSLDRIGYIERNLIRLGVAELVFMGVNDPGRVFNDYIDLAKKYADRKAAVFVNGVLSKIYNVTSSARR